MVIIGPIENQSTKHITLTSSQTFYLSSNFHGTLKSAYHSYHHQTIYFSKQHHIMSIV